MTTSIVWPATGYAVAPGVADIDAGKGRTRLLVLDDEVGVRESVRQVFKDRAMVTLAASAEAALAAAAKQEIDVILLDIRTPGPGGLEFLARVRAAAPASQVIILSAARAEEVAARATQLGAFAYVVKPFDLDEMVILVERARQAGAALRRSLAAPREKERVHGFDTVIGRSTAMQTVLATVNRVAGLRTTVLLTGESGTGKEVIARAIHENSPRACGPLVAINCAAIAKNLLESELFGHERGAFTDAHVRRLGYFENAHRGTIFLDEIGEMNPDTQAKLLRVLEQGTFNRVGGGQQVTVDVRVIAASNRDLAKGMQEGRFRPDLYFRLNVVAIHLPPLRERRDDLPFLIQHFLQRKSTALGLPEREFDREAVNCLQRYGWPGNVRELENVVERALALAPGPNLTVDDLPAHLTGSGALMPRAVAIGNAACLPSLTTAVEQLEQALILDALAQADHNQTRTAEILGTSRQALKYKMTKLGIVTGQHLR